MAVKALPEQGTSLKQTTFTEVIPSNSSLREKTDDLPFWEYIAQLKPEECGKHILYVYRWLENGDTSPTTKLTVPIDEFELQDAIGGGSFRLILKRGPQICKRIEKFVIEGKRKNPEDVTKTAGSNGNGHQSELAIVLQRQTELIEKLFLAQNRGAVIDDAMRGALDLQRQGFSNVVTSVRELAPPPDDPLKDVTKQLFLALIQKLTNPADPIESFQKMASAFASINTGSGNVSLGAEIVRALPVVAQHVAAGVQAYSIAQVQTAQIASQPARPALPQTTTPPGQATITVQPQNATTPAAPATTQENAAATPAQTPAPATAPPQGGAVSAPNLEWIESKIVEILTNQELSVSEAASEALAFLQVAAPNIRDQLVTGGEATLNWLFTNRTILRQVPQNPRLSEFIAKFLALGRGESLENAPANPPTPAPTS